MKKLVSKAHAGRTLALISGKIKVDAEGVFETESHEIEANLMSIGFESVGDVIVVEPAFKLAEGEHTSGFAVEEKKEKNQPRFKRNK